MQCEQCGFDNPDQMKFCVACGHNMQVICGTCGAGMLRSYNFCGECGSPLNPDAEVAVPIPAAQPTPSQAAEPISAPIGESERKQVTVLSCEMFVPGADSLSPDVMHGLLNQFFELAQEEVQQYGGTINRYLSQGFLAIFGAPVAYEDHPHRAVLAGLGLRQKVAQQAADLEKRYGVRWTLRMGLDTGPVVVGGVGGNALGESITVAGQLQQRAALGGALISDSLARAVQNVIETEPDKPITDSEGKKLTVWRLLADESSGKSSEPFFKSHLSPFVGRDHELRVLEELRAQAIEGHGQVVGISGDAGAGKSRLLHEFFRRTFPGRRVSYLRGRCLSYGSGVPYLPLTDMIRRASGISERESPESVIKKLHASLKAVGADAEESLPFFLRLLGVQDGTESLEDIEPQAIQSRTFAAMRRMLLAAGQQSLVVLEIEDLHWIDDTSAEFLDSLVELMGAARLMVLLTYRSGYQPKWLKKSYTTQLNMRKLGEKDSRALIESILKSAELPIDSEVGTDLVAKADGNPLFLEELARALKERKEGDDAVPDNIQGILMARVDRLPEEHKSLLRTASVLGRELSMDLLEAIWDRPEPLPPLLEELQRWELLYKAPAEDQDTYFFKHALTQEVTYQSLLSDRRQELHAKAAETLENTYEGHLEDAYDRLVFHYPRAGQPYKTLYYLTLFADRAATNYSHQEAAKALRQALEHVDQLPEEEQDRRLVEILLKLADSLLPLAEFPETLQLFQGHLERLERVDDVSLAAQYHFWLAHTFTYLGQQEATEEYAAKSIAAAQECGDETTEGKACYVLGRNGFWSGNFSNGIENSLRAVVLLERTGEPWWQGQAYWVAGFNHYVLGQFDQALDALERAYQLGEALDDYRLDTSWSMGYFYASLGEPGSGIELCRRGLERSQDPLNSAVSTGFLGHALMQKGEIDAAIEHLSQGLGLMRQAGMSQLQGWFAAFLGEAHLATGDLEAAKAAALEGLEACEKANFSYGVGLAQRALGEIAAAAGEIEASAEHFSAAHQCFSDLQVPLEVARIELEQARLSGLREDRPGVDESLSRALEIFEGLEVPYFIERTEALRQELA